MLKADLDQFESGNVIDFLSNQENLNFLKEKKFLKTILISLKISQD